MILVNVFKDGGSIKEINVKGHSGYDVEGRDIVCSSVSTVVIITANLLEKLNIDFECISDENVPVISLRIKNVNSKDQLDLVNTILENLVDNLSKVQEEYNKYLKIIIK